MNRAWLLLGASLLAGCGLKGSLTLPEKPGDVVIRPATPGTAATSEPPAVPPAPAPAPTPPPEDPSNGTSRE